MGAEPHKPRLPPWPLLALVALVVSLYALDAVFPPPVARALSASPVVLDRHGQWLRALPAPAGQWRLRADLKRTDPLFVARLVRIEDANFFWHTGVDPIAVGRACLSAIAHGHVTSGASTITMQTARLLEPRRRDLPGKLIQMIRALQLEAHYSKADILSLYLTLTPYGGNLEGVRAASLAWFGHEPSSLTDSEQALLIALPQSPEGRRPDRRPEGARAGRSSVLAKLVRDGLIDKESARDSADEPLPQRQPFPTLAWHAAGELARAAPAGRPTVVSTIDARLQSRLEALARRSANGQGADGQAAILVVEVDGRAVRAAVGSAGRTRAGGWNDLTLALRSPGSALKPMIYGFAFDEGLAAPDTLIDDAPRRFDDYQPTDFDRVFHGPVSAREALEHSLNVPAVAILDRLGAPAFEARIQSAGVHLVRPMANAQDAGLSIALGGEGITLRDLALLYAVLGDGGVAKPLAWTQGEQAARRQSPGVRLMSANSAEQVLDILREAPPPVGRAPFTLVRGTATMAFKTGTSYGFRDALAVGVVGGYVIAVWTGRADGGARPGLTGHAAALPLLFDAADQLATRDTLPDAMAPRAAPRALRRFDQDSDGPHLIFPPDGSKLIAPGFGPGSPGLVLAADGRDLSWYVGGAPVRTDPVSGQAIWRPATPGFYRVAVVDGQGRRIESNVRVTASGP